MNKIRICLAIFLILLMALSWYSFMSGSRKDTSRYSFDLTTGDDFFAQRLYQKAIAAYQEALEFRESLEVRKKLLESYLQSYQDGTSTLKEYQRALENACSLYPQTEELWNQLLDLQMDSLNYTGALSTLRKASNAGIQGEAFETRKKEVIYSFSHDWYTYDAACLTPGGKTTAHTGSRWVVIPKVNRDAEYDYISPLNQQGEGVYRNEKDTRLIDAKGVVQAYLATAFSEARAYGDGMLPIRVDGGWTYLNCETDKIVSAVYEEASSFVDGVAAVKKDGSWILVDTSFNPISGKRFSDVKLYGNGQASFKDCMVAAENGQYALYDRMGQAQNGFAANDMDLYYGELLAFRDGSGQWGYVDKKGTVVIAPSFPAARSFSEGLAAVSDGVNWGFINQNAETVIPCQFVQAYFFDKEGMALVSTQEGAYSFITLRFPDGM